MAIRVSAGRMPGRIATVEVPDGALVNDVLAAAGLQTDGFEVRLDGSECQLDAPVRDGQTVLLVRKIKGNKRQALRRALTVARRWVK